MKTLLFFCTATIIFLFGNMAQAKIWTVDNNAGSPAVVKTAQAAHDSASAGDTLYFVGSPTNYGSLSLTKRLSVFGPGFFLGANPATQDNPNTALITNVTFSTGSDSSALYGIYSSKIIVNVGNILLKRNRIYQTGYYNLSIDIGNNVSSVFIIQNFIERSGGPGYNDAGCIAIGSGCTDIVLHNNVIINHTGNNGSYHSIYSLSPVELVNNVIYRTIRVNNSTLHNNILRFGDFVGTGNSATYNMGDAKQFDTTSAGNLQDVNMTNVFIGGYFAASPDNELILKSGSPAIGAGKNGVDMGVFGGSDPYRLSGLPAIPAIYDISAPPTGSGTEGLPVTIKIKSHN